MDIRGEIRIYLGGRQDIIYMEEEGVFETRDVVGHMVAKLRYNNKKDRQRILNHYLQLYPIFIITIRPDEIQYEEG